MRRHYREATVLNRKTWKNYRKSFVLIFFVLLGACASLPTPPEKPSPVFEQGWLKKSPSDTDIFSKGMFYLGNRERTANYAKAREAFEELKKNYPRSKWQGLSEILISLIDSAEKYDSEKQLSQKAKEDNLKLLKENEQIKKENGQLLEEIAKLVQENEQLKKDIQLLKSLELQLEKREKMLR